MARRIRIALSVIFGVLTLLLMVMWVRSYYRGDVVNVSIPNVRFAYLASIRGELRCEQKRGAPKNDLRLQYHSLPASCDPDRRIPKTLLGFRWPVPQFRRIPVMPYWFVVTTCATLAVVSSRGYPAYRFSLSTLLVATTLVAIVLGMSVWAGR